MLTWSWASEADADEFTAFACCENDTAPPWVIEAENYVRAWALSKADHVLAHRDEHGSLVAVSAFDETVIEIPYDPTNHAGWHLQIVALDIDHQNAGLSVEVFAGIFDAMLELDFTRVFVTANVHMENLGSLIACGRAGITLWYPKDDHYLVLLGEVEPPA